MKEDYEEDVNYSEGQRNLIEFLENALERAKRGEFSAMAGVLFTPHYEDLYYTAGLAPRSVIIGGLTMMLEDLKYYALREGINAENNEDEDDDEGPDPGKTIN